MYSITSDAKKYLNEINVSADNISENSTCTEKAKQIKAQTKTKNINELRLHGNYPFRVSDPDINSSLTHQWLASSGLKSETESFIIAVQDQSLPREFLKHTYQKMMLTQNAKYLINTPRPLTTFCLAVLY